ncbi:hypothetical protein C5167_041557 [Papaver somniferum]|nr:hypothetical protein C5167_041557 [Papaver somniferum]
MVLRSLSPAKKDHGMEKSCTNQPAYTVSPELLFVDLLPTMTWRWGNILIRNLECHPDTQMNNGPWRDEDVHFPSLMVSPQNLVKDIHLQITQLYPPNYIADNSDNDSFDATPVHVWRHYFNYGFSSQKATAVIGVSCNGAVDRRSLLSYLLRVSYVLTRKSSLIDRTEPVLKRTSSAKKFMEGRIRKPGTPSARGRTRPAQSTELTISGHNLINKIIKSPSRRKASGDSPEDFRSQLCNLYWCQYKLHGRELWVWLLW